MHRISSRLSRTVVAAVVVAAAVGLASCRNPIDPSHLGPDTTAPVIDRFTLSSNSITAYDVIRFGLSGSDNVGVTGWLVDESPVPPAAGDPRWLPQAPTNYTITSGTGTKSVYAWVKDAAGNVSAPAIVTVDSVRPGYELVASWNNRFDDGAMGFDQAFSAAVDSSRNLYVVGTGNNLVGSTGADWWIKKFSPSGVEDTTDWNKSFSSSGNVTDQAEAVAVDSRDNVYVVGIGTNLVNSTSGTDWWIKKFSPNGVEDTTNWNKSFSSPGSGNDYATGVAIDSSGNVYVVGSGMNLVAPTTGSDSDWWIRKFSSNGVEDTTNWDKTFSSSGTNADSAQTVAVDSGDNVYVAGYGTNLVNAASGMDWWIKKFSSSGAEDTTNWNKSFDDGNDLDDIAQSVAVGPGGNVYVVGSGTDLVGASTGTDLWIKKFSASGTEDTASWNKMIDDGSGGADQAQAVTVDSNGNVYIAGYGNNLASATSSMDWWIKRYSSSGVEDTTDWNKAFDGGGSGYDQARSIVVDSIGDVSAIGYANNPANSPTDYDWWIKRFVDNRP